MEEQAGGEFTEQWRRFTDDVVRAVLEYCNGKDLQFWNTWSAFKSILELASNAQRFPG